ncbi:MAG: hypothetical protein NT006_06415 [Candidatus Aminicenantes bacterium]|nr:hypothetical protein [Candidatus Aminicenantes bacterium]
MKLTRARRGLSVPAALVAVFFLAPAAGLAQAREGSPKLAALVPRVDAWTQSEAPRSYFPESLFEYIDGAAESYLSYDFRELLVVDLEKKGTEATLTLEIYDMGSPVNAFGIFGAERYPENRAVSIGELGYLEGEALNFMSGRFYVKMLSFGLGEETGSILAGVGAQVAAAVKEKGTLPALVLVFPRKGLVAQSEKYIKKNFMGYEFLRDGYVAAYKADGREMEAFFIEAGSEKDAQGMLEKLLEALAGDKQTPERIALGYHSRNRYGQHLYIGRVRNVLCGVMRVPDGLEAAAGSLLEALTAALAKPPTPK